MFPLCEVENTSLKDWMDDLQDHKSELKSRIKEWKLD